jgi:maleylpyruvate isomerase
MSSARAQSAPPSAHSGPPRRELLWARWGTAYFRRALNALPDRAFAQASLIGWSRAQVIAHVGYNARALCRLLEWAATGVEAPMYASPEQRWQEIELGATLQPIALRHLMSHSAVHLDVEWRDLPEHSWTAEVRTAQGRRVPASQTAWMRAREVWVHAVDLDSGASFVDFPPDVLDALLVDVVEAWRRRGIGGEIALVPTDREDRIEVTAGADHIVTGTAAELARWATGRGVRGVIQAGQPAPRAPRWL